MKKTIIHVTVGDNDWTPTTKELVKVTRQFRKVIKETTPEDVAVIATRRGVCARVIEFDPYNPASLSFDYVPSEKV